MTFLSQNLPCDRSASLFISLKMCAVATGGCRLGRDKVAVSVDVNFYPFGRVTSSWGLGWVSVCGVLGEI